MAISLGGVQFSISIKTGRTASQIDRVTQSLTALNTAAAVASPNMAAIQAALGNFSGQANNAGNSGQGAATGVTALSDSILALGSAIAASKLGSFIADSTLLAGRVENLGTIVENVGTTANYSLGEIRLFEQNIRGLGITTQAAREIMARFAQNNLDLADAVRLARVAQDAAVIAGTNSSEAAEKLATAIFRLDTRMLRNQGILVNLRQEYQAFGLATGRVETSLTAAEKQQITLNAVFRQGLAIAGNYEKSLEDVYKQYTSLSRFQEEASRTLGEQFLPSFGAVVKVATELLKTFEALDPSFKAVIAATLGGATAFFSLAAAVKTAQTAYAAYTVLMTTATSVTAGATVATTGLAAAMGALTAAMRVLFSLPGLIAISALIAGFIFLTAQARNEVEELAKANDKLAASAAAVVNTRDSIEAIRQFGEKTQLTAEEQTHLRAEMYSVVALLPDLKDELNAATDSADAFISVLQKKFPQGFQTFSNFIKQAEIDLEVAREATRKFKEENENLFKAIVIGAPFGGGGNSYVDRKYAELRALEETEKEKERIVKARVDAVNAYEIRRLEELVKLQETGVQLAERIRNRLADSAFKNLKDKSAQAVRDLLEQQRSLTAAMLRNEDLLKLQSAKNQAVDAQKKNDGESDADFEARKRAQKLAVQSEIDQLKRDRQSIVDAFKTSTELAIEELKLEEEEVRLLNEELQLLAEGYSQDAVKAAQEFQRSLAEGDKVMHHYVETIKGFKKEIKEFEDRNLVPGISPAQKTSNEQEIQKRKDQIEIIERAIKTSYNRQVAEARRFQKDLTEIQRKETEERIKNVESEADKSVEAARKIVQERDNAKRTTANFISDVRADLKDFYELPGFKQIYDIVKEFSGAIAGAGNIDQIKQITELFGPSVGKRLDELGAQGAPPQLLARLAGEASQMQQLLRQASVQRIAEIQKQEAEFRVQIQQLTYLQAIYDLLRGNGGALPNLADVGAPPNGGRRRRGQLPPEPDISEDAIQRAYRAAGIPPFPGFDQGGFAGDAFDAFSQGGNPFSRDVKGALNGAGGAARGSTQALRGLSDEIVRSMRSLAIELENQRNIATDTINKLRAVEQGVNSRDKRFNQALQNRGL